LISDSEGAKRYPLFVDLIFSVSSVIVGGIQGIWRELRGSQEIVGDFESWENLKCRENVPAKGKIVEGLIL